MKKLDIDEWKTTFVVIRFIHSMIENDVERDLIVRILTRTHHLIKIREGIKRGEPSEILPHFKKVKQLMKNYLENDIVADVIES